MRGLKGLLVPVVVTVALVGMSVPAGADSAYRPVESPAAGDKWGPLVPVPIPAGQVLVWAVAISDLGHIAVAYTAVARNTSINNFPGDVIVRSPRGVWSAPHRLVPPRTALGSVELGFDAQGNLTAFWSELKNLPCCDPPDPPPPESTYRVATKPAGQRWTRHARVGPVQLDISDVVLSVAPSGRAVIGWRQYQESLDEFQFTVRVRRSVDAPWGPARALSAVSNPAWVTGDVVINDQGTAVAAWKVLRPGPAYTVIVQRSSRTRSGAWTKPVTIGRNADHLGVRVGSTPAGFTAITWVRIRNGNSRTVVVDLRTPRGTWSRDVLHSDARAVDRYHLAVGPHRTVVLVYHLPVRAQWRTSSSDWNTNRLSTVTANARTPAVTSTGRIFVPWSQRSGGVPNYERGFVSTHRRAWQTTQLWDWTRGTSFEAAAVSWNGRAVAIRTTRNLRGRTIAVEMRVLRPG